MSQNFVLTELIKYDHKIHKYGQKFTIQTINVLLQKFWIATVFKPQNAKQQHIKAKLVF